VQSQVRAKFVAIGYTSTRASAENFPEGGQRKKDRKITLFSLYLLYLYHVWKFRGVRPPLPTPMHVNVNPLSSK